MSRYDHTEFGESRRGVFESSLGFWIPSSFPVSWDKTGAGVQFLGDPGLEATY